MPDMLLSSGKDNLAIVADIGGTNARFCCVDLAHLAVDKVAVYPCSDFSSIDDAFYFYQQKNDVSALKQAAIAIACPVTSDLISMTNFHWQFSISELKSRLRLNQLQVINDFTAQAMSLTALHQSEKVQIGNGIVDMMKPMVVLGAGTGLGVAHLIPTDKGFMPLAGEGGHSSWAAQNEQEWFIERFLSKQYGHVSLERLLSGQGLENIYLALAAFSNQSASPLTASQIANLALSKQSLLAKATVLQFLATLGSFAGDLALLLGAFGGVYLAGGILPKLLPLIDASEFRQRFEAKGRFSDYNRQIATFVVAAEQPGLLGAAVYLKQTIVKEYYGNK